VMGPHLALAGMVTSILARITAERVGAASSFLATGLVELNGWFLGLACATFFAVGPGLAAAVLLGGPLAAALSIVMQRLLATWDVPLLVGPYVPSFWLLWSALAVFPWAKQAVLPVVPVLPASLATPWLLVGLGGLRGVGQIFFLPNAGLGIALALAVSIADWRLGPAMVGASVASVAIAHVAGAPAWQVELGLAGFTPALVAVAALRGFAGLGAGSVAVAVIAAPFVESASLRLASSVGLHALSASYIALVWTFAVLRPVRTAESARAGWSAARPGPAATHAGSAPPRARIFENG
jgi:urea transporter